MHARHIGFGNLVFAVIGPNVAVYIKKPRTCPRGDCVARDFPTRSIAALQGSETVRVYGAMFSLRACDPGRRGDPFSGEHSLTSPAAGSAKAPNEIISNQSCAQS